MTSPTDGDCRCVWGRDEDGLPECQDGDCRCPQHCVDEDTGLPIGEAVTGDIQAWAPIEVVERLTAERDALKAQVQRVRDVLGDVGK